MIEQHARNSKPVIPVSLLRRAYERVGGSLVNALAGRAQGDRSLMAFSSLGKLTCVCHPEGGREVQKDRRGSCRACGHQVVVASASELSREMSKAEIRMMVKSLERAVARGDHQAMRQMSTSTEEMTQVVDA